MESGISGLNLRSALELWDAGLNKAHKLSISQFSFIKKEFYLFFRCAGSLLLHWLSSCGEQGPRPSSCGKWGSLVVASRLWSTGSTIVVDGLSRSMAGGVLPDQGPNPCLLHWQVDSSPLSHQGSPDLSLQVCKDRGAHPS